MDKMKYRPNGYKNPFEYVKKLKPTGKSWEIERARYAAYEAGADAMLEMLKEEGEACHFNCDVSCNHQRGWKVFISDE